VPYPTIVAPPPGADRSRTSWTWRYRMFPQRQSHSWTRHSWTPLTARRSAGTSCIGTAVAAARTPQG
jgi:hypothetical protein